MPYVGFMTSLPVKLRDPQAFLELVDPTHGKYQGVFASFVEDLPDLLGTGTNPGTSFLLTEDGELRLWSGEDWGGYGVWHRYLLKEDGAPDLESDGMTMCSDQGEAAVQDFLSDLSRLLAEGEKLVIQSAGAYWEQTDPCHVNECWVVQPGSVDYVNLAPDVPDQDMCIFEQWTVEKAVTHGNS